MPRRHHLSYDILSAVRVNLKGVPSRPQDGQLAVQDGGLVRVRNFHLLEEAFAAFDEVLHVRTEVVQGIRGVLCVWSVDQSGYHEGLTKNEGTNFSSNHICGTDGPLYNELHNSKKLIH